VKVQGNRNGAESSKKINQRKYVVGGGWTRGKREGDASDHLLELDKIPKKKKKLNIPDLGGEEALRLRLVRTSVVGSGYGL